MRRLIVALAAVAFAGAAHADGVLSIRGAYYKERSTRVIQPMVDAAFDTGDGRVEGHFLIDSITSASAATGTGGLEFTERRWEAGLGYTHELPGHVKLGAEAKYSTESDYYSTWLAAKVEIGLNEQNTMLRLLGGHSFDRITNGVAVGSGAIGTPFREEHLGITLVSLGATQLLAPWLVGRLTYDFSLAEGYQANVYRVVRGGTEPVPERVPDRRVRHAVAAGARAWFPTGTTGVLEYRLYLDDWGILAHTIDARAIQEIVPGLDVKAHYRLYTQGAADFYQDVYTQEQVLDPQTYVTADGKLASFVSHTLGGQVSGALSLLGVQGDWGEVRFDLTVERVWQTSVFGNAWVAQVGMSVPFSY
jgi:hypothetical protein